MSQQSTEPKPAQQPSSPAPQPQPAAQATPDEPLGDNGKKALEAEREARKAAEKDLAAMRGEFDTFKTALSGALGVKPEDTSAQDAMAALQQRMDAMQHDGEVYRLAAQHQITEQTDIDLLRSAKDAESMRKLAERLAAKGSDNTPGTPKPDGTQGAKAGASPTAGNPAEQFAQFLGAQLGQ